MLIDLENVPDHLFSRALESNLRCLARPYKVYSHFLTSVLLRLEADSAFLYRGLAGDEFEDSHSEGRTPQHSSQLVHDFAARRRPEIPRHILLSPLKVHGRLAGVVGAERHGRDFDLGQGRILNKLSALLGGELTRREEERLVRVLGRITEKVISQLDARDLAYQILDGLYQLVHYDHSAALLIYEPSSKRLRVEAEKIVWAKAKSEHIGHETPVSRQLFDDLQRSPGVRVLAGRGEADQSGAQGMLHQVLNYAQGQGTPQETSLLCAPLLYGNEFLGLLKMAAFKRASFDRHDAEVVERFLPAARVALRNARVKVSLENMALQAEMRAELVTLARAVAHDVNNAIGAILPLAEQALEETRRGDLDADELEKDLEVIVEKASLCKRIFYNMLRAGKERTATGPVDVARLAREMTPMLESMVGLRGIALQFDLQKDLPLLRCSRQHLERILWNLVTNSAQALAGKSGRILVSARLDDPFVNLIVADNGPGIDRQDLSKVLEPFFTTKSDGTGLGLSICRSLVWQHGGTIDVRSAPGRGTEVEIRLPAAEVAETVESMA